MTTAAATLLTGMSVLGGHRINRRVSQVGDDLQDARSANLELVQQRRRARIDVSINSEVSTLPIASSLVRIQLPAHFLLSREDQHCPRISVVV